MRVAVWTAISVLCVGLVLTEVALSLAGAPPTTFERWAWAVVSAVFAGGAWLVRSTHRDLLALTRADVAAGRAGARTPARENGRRT